VMWRVPYVRAELKESACRLTFVDLQGSAGQLPRDPKGRRGDARVA
jgi:hypothetical protein